MKRTHNSADTPPKRSSGTAKRARRSILLVDDHPLMRSGMAGLIGMELDLEVVAEAGSGEEALKSLSKRSFDLLITDLTMPGQGGLDFIKVVHRKYPKLPILVVSMHDEMIHAERTLRAGSLGYIMKEAGGARLIVAIRCVLDGQMYVSEKLSEALLNNLSGRRQRSSDTPTDKLTDREFQVFQMIGNGKSTREIADELKLSTKTVDVHRANIKTKLSLYDASSLIRFAVQWVETSQPGESPRI